jgi:hypothetical protein
MLAGLRRTHALRSCGSLAEPIVALSRHFAQPAAEAVVPPGDRHIAVGVLDLPTKMWRKCSWFTSVATALAMRLCFTPLLQRQRPTFY